MTPIHVVIVRWHHDLVLERCLASLFRHGGSRLGAVTLVDSGSGDGGAERIAALSPRVDLVVLEENHSFARAANLGAARSTEPFLLLLNPDTEITEGALDDLGRALEARPDAAGVAPLLLGADGRPQHRWQLRRLPSRTRLALGLPGSPLTGVPPGAPCPVDQPAAAAWLIRRQVWADLGGFDDSYRPAWWEDVDLCARLAARRPPEERFWVEPGVRLLHQGGSSLEHLPDQTFLTAYHRNLMRFARSHHPLVAPTIERVLRLVLRLRALLSPCRRSAYLAAARAIAGS